jgi:hypothetical protein
LEVHNLVLALVLEVVLVLVYSWVLELEVVHSLALVWAWVVHKLALVWVLHM